MPELVKIITDNKYVPPSTDAVLYVTSANGGLQLNAKTADGVHILGTEGSVTPSATGDYLPLTGGVLSGSSATVSKDTNSGSLVLLGGTQSGGGASLVLTGANASKNAGAFILSDALGNSLEGHPSGELKWKGKNLVRTVNGYPPDSKGNIIVAGGGVSASVTLGGDITGGFTLNENTPNVSAALQVSGYSDLTTNVTNLIASMATATENISSNSERITSLADFVGKPENYLTVSGGSMKRGTAGNLPAISAVSSDTICIKANGAGLFLAGSSYVSGSEGNAPGPVDTYLSSTGVASSLPGGAFALRATPQSGSSDGFETWLVGKPGRSGLTWGGQTLLTQYSNPETELLTAIDYTDSFNIPKTSAKLPDTKPPEYVYYTDTLRALDDCVLVVQLIGETCGGLNINGIPVAILTHPDVGNALLYETAIKLRKGDGVTGRWTRGNRPANSAGSIGKIARVVAYPMFPKSSTVESIVDLLQVPVSSTTEEN